MTHENFLLPVSGKGNMPRMQGLTITVREISGDYWFVRVMRGGELVTYEEFDRSGAQKGVFGLRLPPECQEILISMVKGGATVAAALAGAS